MSIRSRIHENGLQTLHFTALYYGVLLNLHYGVVLYTILIMLTLWNSIQLPGTTVQVV